MAKETKKVIVQSSFPICTATFVTLLILKLAKVIEIAWIWVFAPYWIPVGIFLSILVVYFLVMGVAVVIAAIKDRLDKR